MYKATFPVMLFVFGSAFFTPAWAVKTMCCVNDQGRNICGDTLPQECYGRAFRIINEHGMTIRRVEAPLTAEQRAQREIELARKKREAEAAYEERRRDDALLAAYASESEFDIARDRALEVVMARSREIQAKWDEAQKQKKKLDSELEFYKKKGPPEAIKQQIKSNALELETIQMNLDAKKQEMEKITARYEAERQRYVALKQGTIVRKPLPPAPGVGKQAAAAGR